MIGRLKRMLGLGKSREPDEGRNGEKGSASLLHEDQQEWFERDMSIIADEDNSRGDRVQEEAEKEVRSAARDSLKKLHVMQRGHCPLCGDNLRQHLFASICDACGWHTYEAPRHGPVRVHLANSSEKIEGERCYEVKSGGVLVIDRDVVTARIPALSVSWIEYVWDPKEIDQRHRQVVDRMELRCGWCAAPADPDKEGFHLVHAAFGAAQERYCFCGDDCYEAFRKMYPARVHRDCYERNCSECDLCMKRYGDEADGLRVIAKDYLSTKSITKAKDQVHG